MDDQTSATSMLLSVLQDAEKPLTLGELSVRLVRPFRAVAGSLAAACDVGSVIRLEGGLYALAPRPALADLLAVVSACEARWNLGASGSPLLREVARRSEQP
jgi:hypothetical protein